MILNVVPKEVDAQLESNLEVTTAHELHQIVAVGRVQFKVEFLRPVCADHSGRVSSHIPGGVQVVTRSRYKELHRHLDLLDFGVAEAEGEGSVCCKILDGLKQDIASEGRSVNASRLFKQFELLDLCYRLLTAQLFRIGKEQQVNVRCDDGGRAAGREQQH